MLRSLLAAGLLLPASLHALPPAVTAGRSGAALSVDGVLDEPAWATAGVIPDLVQQSPVSGGTTPYRTEVRALADPDGLILGFVCTDPEPNRIGIHTMLRDGDLGGDDQITVVLDTFGDGRNGYFFRFNAAGAMQDGLISGPETISTDWDGIWTVAVRRVATGWTAEMLLPSRTLRFRKDLPSWGLNVDRYVPRALMSLRWSGTTLDSKLWDLSRAGRLEGLGNLTQGLGLSVVPYALGRRVDTADGEDAALKGTAGIDVGWSPTPDLGGVVTVNTDFAETDVDTRQINLTRFPLFFPEKRSFFLEGSNLFTFGLGLNRTFAPFYSRRVGLYEGEAVPIDVGAKVIARSGAFSLAALDVGMRGTDLTEKTNLFAGRLTWDVDPHLRIGALVTDGDPAGRAANTLAGLDAVWRTSSFAGDKNFAVGAWGAASRGDLPDGQRTGWGIKVDYPNDLWDVTAKVNEFGDALSPALGFLPRPGTRQWTGAVEYMPRPREGPLAAWVNRFFFVLVGELVTDLSGRMESWEVFTAPLNFRLKSGDSAEVGFVREYELLTEPFEVEEGVAIPPGRYEFTRSRLEATSSSKRRWKAGGEVSWGGFYSGHLTEVSGFAAFSDPGGHLQLRLAGLANFGDLPEGSFVQRLWQLNTTYAMSPDLVLSVNGQYDTVSKNLGFFARARWTLEPGRELILVWNHDWQEQWNETDRTKSYRFASDELVLKLRWTFRG